DLASLSPAEARPVVRWSTAFEAPSGYVLAGGDLMDDRVQRVHELIDRELPRRHANRVLHGHPSPMFWLERDVPVAEIVRTRNRPGFGAPRGLIAYVGTPFCLPTAPERCGFCLFPSEVYRSPDQLVTYLRHLAKEGELYRGWFDDTEV